MFKKALFFIVIMLIVAIAAEYNLFKKAEAAEIEHFADYVTVTFEAGSYFSVILHQPLDSSINKEDDIFVTLFPSDVYIGEMLVIPQGSKAIGRVTYLERAHMGRDAMINVRFISIVPANGTGEIPIRAFVKDKNADGSLGGNLTPRKNIKVIVHNVERIGPYGQAIETGPRIMGQEIYIPPGERWVIQLEEPARFVIPK
jgi:hypothetical protein